MKVYELMTELAQLPSGKDVKIHLLKSLNEMTEVEEDIYDIEFHVKSVCDLENVVEIDGWNSNEA